MHRPVGNTKTNTLPLSILFVIGRLGTGGKERQLVELIHGLKKRGYELHLLVKNNDASFLDKIRDDLASFHSLEKKQFHFLDFLKIAAIINSTKPDIVSIWAVVAGYFILPARLFTPCSYKLINCCIRNAPLRLSLSKKIERFMYSFFPTVVSNSKAGLVAYGQQKKKGRHVLYNGFDFNRVPDVSRQAAKQELGFPVDKKCIVMVASLTEKKDHEMFIDCAARLLTQRDDIIFYLIGDGYRREILQAKVCKLGIESSVLFLGNRDDVELIFRAADLSILTSTAWFGEGISNSILESLACGTPVIATDSPGTREVIEDEKNGLIVPCGDSGELADKVGLLLGNPNLMNRLGDKGRKTVEKKFSLSEMIEGFIRIIGS